MILGSLSIEIQNAIISALVNFLSVLSTAVRSTDSIRPTQRRKLEYICRLDTKTKTLRQRNLPERFGFAAMAAAKRRKLPKEVGIKQAVAAQSNITASANS